MYNVEESQFECPVEALSIILGKKWVAIIIWTIQDKHMRFGDLQRAVSGCSKKMLTQQLELLIKNDIVINEKELENNTARSTYYLSQAGLTLLPIMKQMIGWSNENLSCEEHKK